MKKVIRPQEAKSAAAAQISAEETARFFRERKARADFEAFDRIMKRPNGASPIPGDELPDAG
jgi:hypothetical protein